MGGGTRSVIGATPLFPPLDVRLKIPRRGGSARLQRKVCEANDAGSFEKASRLLRNLAGLAISAKRVELITERVGQRLREETQSRTERFLARQGPKGSGARAALLVVSMDGGRVQTRQDDPTEKWKEDKVGVVYDARPCPERTGVAYEGPPPGTRSVRATMESWETLGNRLSALADTRGYARARQRVCIGDGAAAIRSIKDRCFPDAVFILDWAHAVEHLHQAAQAGFGPGPKAESWFESQKERLWHGRLSKILSQIERLCRRAGPPPKRAAENDPRRILANNLHYFQTNRAAMNYPAFRKNGWPLGSGIIESTVKQIGKRLKGTEKHWSLSGVEQTLHVLAHLISDDGAWDDFWKRCPLASAA
jgi:hypothetical protein